MRHFLRTVQAITLTALTGASSASLSAQRIGVTTGVTYSHLETSGGFALTNRAGALLGVSFQFALNDALSLQPELLVLNKGAKASGDFATDCGTISAWQTSIQKTVRCCSIA